MTFLSKLIYQNIEVIIIQKRGIILNNYMNKHHIILNSDIWPITYIINTHTHTENPGNRRYQLQPSLTSSFFYIPNSSIFHLPLKKINISFWCPKTHNPNTHKTERKKATELIFRDFLRNQTDIEAEKNKRKRVLPSERWRKEEKTFNTQSRTKHKQSSGESKREQNKTKCDRNSR